MTDSSRITRYSRYPASRSTIISMSRTISVSSSRSVAAAQAPDRSGQLTGMPSLTRTA